MLYGKSIRVGGIKILIVLLSIMLGTAMNSYCDNSLAKSSSRQTENEKQLATSEQVSKSAVAKEEKKAENIKEELNVKAVEAVAQTYHALDLLNKGKSKEALEILKDIIGELEIILTANKDAALVPINSYHVIVDTRLSDKEIEKELAKVKKLLYEGEVQKARILLNTLQSEIDIIIEQLPLATYPDAIKLASKYIIDKKIKEAQSVLTIALNSMVVKTIVIPLPLVKATDLIQAASENSKSHKDKAIEYLNEAKKQLKIAELLGYGKSYSSTYQELKKKIENIQQEIKGKNQAAKLFEDLLQKIKELKHNIQKIQK